MPGNIEMNFTEKWKNVDLHVLMHTHTRKCVCVCVCTRFVCLYKQASSVFTHAYTHTHTEGDIVRVNI